MDQFNVPITGVLRIPARSECCVRRWLLEHPHSPLSGVIPRLLAGGFSFRILTPTAPGPVPLLPSPQLLPLNRQDSNVQSVYRMNLATLLSRPRARRFVTYGGLFWRLTLHYSESLTSQDLIVSTLNGPTIAASLVEPGLYDDEIADEEIAALLGTATDGSTLWPPETVFYCSDRWVGRWTPDNESWFQKHFLKISIDIVGCFRTRRQWLRNGFQIRRQAAQNVVGSEDYAKSICIQHDVEFSPFPLGRMTNL